MTNHLTVEQIIEFVSINELNEENIKKMTDVNTHVYRCEECAEKVRAFQAIYDEFVRLGQKDEAGNELAKLYEERQNRMRNQIQF